MLTLPSLRFNVRKMKVVFRRSIFYTHGSTFEKQPEKNHRWRLAAKNRCSRQDASRIARKIPVYPAQVMVLPAHGVIDFALTHVRAVRGDLEGGWIRLYHIFF